MKFVSVLFLFCWVFLFSVFAQQPPNKGIEEVAIELPVLPPLSVLIDSALARSPQMKILIKEKQGKEINLKMTKRNWMNDLSLRTGYTYGKGSTLGTSESSLTSTPTAVLSDRSMSQYNVGISWGTSLGALVDRKSRTKLAKIEVDKMEDQIKLIRNEIELNIYEEYNNLEMNIESLKSMATMCDSYKAQLLLTEKDYLNNRAQLSQLTASKEAYLKAMLELDKQKRACRTSVFRLEQITGVHFAKR